MWYILQCDDNNGDTGIKLFFIEEVNRGDKNLFLFLQFLENKYFIKFYDNRASIRVAAQ